MSRWLRLIFICLLTISIAGVSAFVPDIAVYGATGTLYENYTTWNANDIFYGNYFKAQTFTPKVSHTITNVSIPLLKMGSPSGDVVISIRAIGAGGLPTGGDLASGRVSLTSITNAWSPTVWYNFDLGTGYQLVAGQAYAIVWQAPSATSTAPIYDWVNTAGTYAGGQAAGSADGINWAAIAGGAWDALFQESGVSGIPPSPTPSPSPSPTPSPTPPPAPALYESYASWNANDIFYGSYFKAQTFTPSVSHTVNRISLPLLKTGNPAGDVIISIRNTDANGLPTGGDLISAKFSISLITSAWSPPVWYNFDFGAGYPLAAGRAYAIVWQAPNADASNSLYYWTNTAGTYSGGRAMTSSGGINWTAIAGGAWDSLFQEFGTGGVSPTPIPTPTPAPSPTPTPSPIPSPGWWNSAWSRRAPVTVTETSGANLVDYQTRITVPYDPDMQSNFNDIRFIDGDNSTVLDYWRRSYIYSGTAVFWVKVPSIPAWGSRQIYMYFGNPGAVTLSNIHNTFIWGDDFEDPAWTSNNIHPVNYWGATQYIQNGQYHMSGPPTAEPIAELYQWGSLKQFPSSYIAETDVQPLTGVGTAYISPRYQWTENKYECFIDARWSNIELAKKDNGAWTSLGSAYLGYNLNIGGWYSLKSAISGSGSTNRLQAYVNDALYLDKTDSSLQYPGLSFLAYYWNDNFHFAFDNFRVRQYASSEPAVSIGPKQ